MLHLSRLVHAEATCTHIEYFLFGHMMHSFSMQAIFMYLIFREHRKYRLRHV